MKLYGIKLKKTQLNDIICKVEGEGQGIVSATAIVNKPILALGTAKSGKTLPFQFTYIV